MSLRGAGLRFLERRRVKAFQSSAKQLQKRRIAHQRIQTRLRSIKLKRQVEREKRQLHVLEHPTIASAERSMANMSRQLLSGSLGRKPRRVRRKKRRLHKRRPARAVTISWLRG